MSRVKWIPEQDVLICELSCYGFSRQIVLQILCARYGPREHSSLREYLRYLNGRNDLYVEKPKDRLLEIDKYVWKEHSISAFTRRQLSTGKLTHSQLMALRQLSATDMEILGVKYTNPLKYTPTLTKRNSRIHNVIGSWKIVNSQPVVSKPLLAGSLA